MNWFVIIDRNGLYHTTKFDNVLDAEDYINLQFEEGRIKEVDRVYLTEEGIELNKGVYMHE
ncbi:MAG TPA: hypothetical protein VK071_02995 [Tissierellales bacterium]|nr:hypothetical protein [Tissierellales bacterium]